MSLHKVHDETQNGISLEKDLKETELPSLIKSAKDSILPDDSQSDPYKNHIKINHCYITCFSLVWCFASNIQGGWVIAETGQIGFIFDVQLEWGAQKEKGQVINMITVLILLGTFGMAIGSFFSGKVAPMFGIRKTILFCNFMSLIFNCLRMVLTTPTVMIGRFFFGFFVAFQQFCFAKAINDTIPSEVQQYHSSLLNSGIALGIFLSNCAGFAVPLDDGRENALELMKKDTNWYIVIAIPTAFNVISIILISIFYKHPSLINLMESDAPDAQEILENELKKIYTVTPPMTYQLLAERLKGQTYKQKEQVGIKEGLFSPKYRRASWNALALAYENIMCGIVAIMTFQNLIFLDMKKRGNFNFPVNVAVQMVNGFNFLIAFFSPIVFEKFSQRRCLLFGQTVICIAHVCIIIFNEYNLDSLVLAMILLFILGFEVSVGPGFFVHTQETTLDSILGLSNMVLSFFIIACQISVPLLVEHTGSRGTFSFFLACCLIAMIHLIFVLRDSTYKADGKTKLTEKDKKELYMPEEFKQKS